MNCIGTYDGTIFYNPANKFCIVSVKTADQSVPAEARSNRRYKDHLIRFTAVGYEIPRTDAVELELDGEWAKGKYGVQLQVEQWREIVPRTKNGVEGYLASGLIKGIGPKTAADIVERFGVDTLDILEHQPERLLEIRGMEDTMLNASEVMDVNKNAVRTIARIAARLRTLFFMKYCLDSRLMVFVLLLPNRMSFIVPPPLLYDFAILNPNNTVGELGDLIVMSNHYKSLLKFLAGYFQKPQHITAGLAVQVAGRFVCQNDSGL